MCWKQNTETQGNLRGQLGELFIEATKTKMNVCVKTTQISYLQKSSCFDFLKQQLWRAMASLICMCLRWLGQQNKLPADSNYFAFLEHITPGNGSCGAQSCGILVVASGIEGLLGLILQ